MNIVKHVDNMNQNIYLIFFSAKIKIFDIFIRNTVKNVENMNKILHLQQLNNQLQERVEFLQKRERDLLESLMKTQKRK